MPAEFLMSRGSREDIPHYTENFCPIYPVRGQAVAGKILVFGLSPLFFNTLSPGGWYPICNYSHAKEIIVGASPSIDRQRGGAVARYTCVLSINAGLADTLQTLPSSPGCSKRERPC